MAAQKNFTSFSLGGLHIRSRRTKSAYMLLLPVIVAALVLTACTSGNSSTSSSSTKADSMASAMKLALGTLKLEGTEQAVDSQAAAQLLPLWQLLDELDNNASAAPAEFTAVTEEIQMTMTPAQIKAIEAMELTQADVVATSNGSGSTTVTTSATPSAGGQNISAGAAPLMGGGAPGGGMPPDGGGPMPGGNAQSSASSSKTSSTSQPTLIKQVIRLLENKAQG